ncbi:MAG: bifunctional pyr operon transcriptional regulator/uracil phosphoribosyltransferase PyrR [Erysipelotrichia bacterium]|nr:bifunctional pyr operon transcriptional regulator/uracil phosphoribosyltransferase PyrR [Erysipelotrichia bacterium]NCC53995.1 bifunctional pyr operon transcriptional regulator/uracil phosphoribosyltransferase PyrR [Erysipelotrichia bacterium]
MKEILDEAGMKRSLVRITHEILERNKGVDNTILVGIQTRGEFIAKRLQANIEQFEGKKIPCISLDIHYWRDDVLEKATPPALNIDVQDKKIILVDDVLFKGRTVRAAMDAIMSFGRAKEIQLAVLVDRGHRELPIRADYVGKNIPSSIHEAIKVKVKEIDKIDGIYIM